MKEPSVGGDEMTECAASLTEDLMVRRSSFTMAQGLSTLFSSER